MTTRLDLSKSVLAALATVTMIACACVDSDIAYSTGLNGPLPTPRARSGTFRIVAFGSSSTQGIGATSVAKTYPAQVERMLDEAAPVEVVNRGIGGDDIDAMSKRMDRDVLSLHPDLVIWQVGSNDAFSKIPVDRFERELRNDISEMQATGAEVILMEPQWCPDLAKIPGARSYLQAVQSVAAERHLTLVPRYEMMIDWFAHGVKPEDVVGPDGLHMTDKGYGMLAKTVADIVRTKSHAYRTRFAS